jgi:hypothetical protein
VRDGVLLSAVSNLFGAAWGLQGPVGLDRAQLVGNVSGLAALGDGWLRLQGGDRPNGVAMGRAGTKVRRQAADLVLADDDFATLVEALVEGRGFWQNLRRGLGVLLGGNLGELGLIVGATLLGRAAPLNTRQILTVNLITDALPAVSLVLQRPEHRDLRALAREGTAALDASLRGDVLRRGLATAVPSLAAFLLAERSGIGTQAGTVASPAWWPPSWRRRWTPAEAQAA